MVMTPDQQHGQIIQWLRHIANQNDRILEILETERTGRLRVFLSRIWNASCEHLATNIGQWVAGLPLWFIALEWLGLRQLLARLFG